MLIRSEVTDNLRLGIPSESGPGFRREGGHHSETKVATHSDVKAATFEGPPTDERGRVPEGRGRANRDR